MKRIGYVAAGLALGVLVALQLPSAAQDSSTGTSGQRTVTVSGTATIKSAPDEAVISLGVQTQAGSAQQALQENANKMTAVLSAISSDGIGKDDIATSGVNLYPNYGQNGNAITGYQASNQVDVTVRDMSKVGTVIDDAVGAGANLANGITFQLSDQNAGLNDALAAAVIDAKTKAQTLATAGGAQLGQVVSIREDSAPQPPVYFDRYASAGAASSAPTPVNPPTIQTQVSVTVVWSLA